MASKTLNRAADGTGSLSPNTAVTLQDSDPTLTISIGTGLASGAYISMIEFYAEDTNHNKTGPVIGTWYQSPPPGKTSNPPVGVSVAASGTSAVLTDINYGTTEPDYYYKVTASDRTSADPELILKKRQPPT